MVPENIQVWLEIKRAAPNIMRAGGNTIEVGKSKNLEEEFFEANQKCNKYFFYGQVTGVALVARAFVERGAAVSRASGRTEVRGDPAETGRGDWEAGERDKTARVQAGTVQVDC